jgi:predicted nucleic acid-binding protein
MKKRELFVDTNILIDLATQREPFSTYARELFMIAEEKSIIMNICVMSYNIVYYNIKKHFGREKAKMAIRLLSDIANCLPVDQAIIRKAMKSSFHDFEDAIQYYCALQIPKCEAIITRNVKDFKSSTIPAMRPDTFLGDEI